MQKLFIVSFALVFALAPFVALSHEGPHALPDAHGQNVGVEASPASAPAAGSALGLFKPDSPLYSFQRLGEWMRLRLAFNPLERAKYELTLMERRAEEIRDLAQRGRLTVERAEALQQRGEKLLNNASRRIEAARERGVEVGELATRMQTLLDRQQTVLQGVLERVPDEAQDAIQRAIEVSRTGKERILKILERMPLPPSDRPVATPVEPGARPTTVPPATPRPMPTGTISWEECSRNPGAIFTLSYPGQCITPDGRRAIQPVPDEERSPHEPVVVPSPSPRASPTVLNIVVEADDNGLYPATITVARGRMVTLTFAVRSTNVYYGGLEFRSPKFNVPAVMPGSRNSVTFLADESFSYTSWWPATNVKKADGQVNVE